MIIMHIHRKRKIVCNSSDEFVNSSSPVQQENAFSLDKTDKFLKSPEKLRTTLVCTNVHLCCAAAAEFNKSRNRGKMNVKTPILYFNYDVDEILGKIRISFSREIIQL